METLPKRKSEIISLADQHKEQIENRKDGVKIGTKQFQCTCMPYVKINGADAISFEDWKALYSADTCYYCGKHIEGRDKTVDHKIPISRGGTNAKENLVMCCQSCNSHKNNKTELEFYKWREKKNERSKNNIT